MYLAACKYSSAIAAVVRVRGDTAPENSQHEARIMEPEQPRKVLIHDAGLFDA